MKSYSGIQSEHQMIKGHTFDNFHLQLWPLEDPAFPWMKFDDFSFKNNYQK